MVVCERETLHFELEKVGEFLGKHGKFDADGDILFALEVGKQVLSKSGKYACRLRWQ